MRPCSLEQYKARPHHLLLHGEAQQGKAGVLERADDVDAHGLHGGPRPEGVPAVALGLHDDADLAEPATAADEPRCESEARLEAEPLAQVDEFVEHPRGVEDLLGLAFRFLVKGDAQLHEQRPVIAGEGIPEVHDRRQVGWAHEVLAVGVADGDLALEAHALVDDHVGGLDDPDLGGAFLLEGVDDLLEFRRRFLCRLLGWLFQMVSPSFTGK